MDKDTSIAEMKAEVQKFFGDRDWDKFHNPKDLSIMLVTEVAELIEIFRYKNEEEVKKIMSGTKRINVEEEVADIFIAILRFAQMNDIDLSTVLRDKIEKNNIKYPIDKCKGKNLKYNEY